MDLFRRLLFFALCFTFILPGCVKEDFTLPADVNVAFKASAQEILSGNVWFLHSYMNVERLRFIGNRNVADDIDFEKDISGLIAFDLYAESVPTFNINIPQGIYDRFTIQMFVDESNGDTGEIDDEIDDWLLDLEEFKNNDDDDNEDFNDDLIDLQEDLGEIIEEYLEDIGSGIRMEGVFSFGGIERKLIFVVDDQVTINIPVKNEEGSPAVSFKKEIENPVNVVFDPSYWFAALSPQILQNSFYGITDDSQEIIFIHKRINPELYTILYSRFEASFKGTKLN